MHRYIRRYKEIEDYLLSEEELKPIDGIVDKFRAQQLSIREEGFFSRLLNAITFTDSISDRFGNHAGEYFRLRRVLPNELSKLKQNYTNDNELLVLTLANSLRREANLVNKLFSLALGKKLVEEGLGAKVEQLEEKNRKSETKFIEAQRRIKQLETYIRIHNGNPDDANDTIVSDPFEGGGNH